MSQRTRPPFRADHVGSLLRPTSTPSGPTWSPPTPRRCGELEAKDDLKRRIEEASRYVDVDQLCLSPQCGFSSTVEGNALTRDQQLAKLRLVVEVADEVWGRTANP
jgi:methionine synthase II (cobalamin-independent)